MRDLDVSKKRVPNTLINKIPTARKLLGQLQNIYRGNSIKFRKVFLPDGNTYIVSDYHGRKSLEIIGSEPEIKTCTAMLDTGIYYVPPTILYVNAEPPRIEYSDALFPENIERLWFGPINITQYVKNEIKEFAISFPIERYIDSWDFIDMTEEFGDPPSKTSVTVFNNIIHKWPASCWTGLTRLFMQAIYGAHRSDLSAVTAGENIWDIGQVTLGSVIIDYNFNIFRDEDTLTYWVVNNRNTSVEIRNLDLSPCSKVLLKWYKANKETIKIEEIPKIEAYIFSGASIGDIVETVSFDAGALGSPWYYGWKSNKNGSKFAVVTIDQEQSTHRFTGTLSEIGLKYDPLAEENKFSVDVLQNRSEQFFLKAGHDRVWIPDNYGGGMSMVVPHPLNQGSFIPSSDAPVYCLYENNVQDELKVIGFKSTNPVSNEAYAGLSAPVSVYVCSDDLPSDQSYGTHSQASRGFGGIINTSLSGHTSSKWWFEFKNACSENRSDCQSGWMGATRVCTDGFWYQNCGVDPQLPGNENLWPTTTLRSRGDVADWFWYRVNNGIRTKSIQSMMVIPWHDAAAVYTMGYENETNSQRTESYRHISSAWQADMHYGSWTQCDWAANCPLTPFVYIAPGQCFPSIDWPEEMWDCRLWYGSTDPNTCTCRPPGPCGGDGPPGGMQFVATRWDLMGGPVTTSDTSNWSNTTYQSHYYSVNGRIDVDDDWHSLYNASVYAYPFVSMPIKSKVSYNGLSMFNKNQNYLEQADPYKDTEYKFFIGWQ